MTIGARYDADDDAYVRVYAETGGSTCASTAAAQDGRSGVTKVIGQLAPWSMSSATGRWTPAETGQVLFCGYLYETEAGTPLATAAATVRVQGAAAAPTLGGSTLQKLTRSGITVNATFTRACTYSARGVATLDGNTYAFTVSRVGKGTFAAAGTTTIRLAPSSAGYTTLRARLDAGRTVAVNVTVAARYSSRRYSSTRAITLK